MKNRWILIMILFVLILESCSPPSLATGDTTALTPMKSQPKGELTQRPFSDASQNPIQSINTPDSAGLTPLPPDTDQFVKLAKEDLAERLKISLDEISFLKITDIDWQDITQGCVPTPGQTLTKGRLSGYRIWLEANGRDYIYHIGLDGKIFLCPN